MTIINVFICLFSIEQESVQRKALMAHFDLELHQMHVKNVFLNKDIDETIYMV